jgi:hypothetical protein
MGYLCLTIIKQPNCRLSWTGVALAPKILENWRQKIKIGDFFGSNIFGARATPVHESLQLGCLIIVKHR